MGVLLCYGEARTGRESCLFGAEEARLQGNGNGNAAARAVPVGVCLRGADIGR